MMFDLSGKIALVTGASGSLGQEIAYALAKAGADIACHYYTQIEPVELLVEKISQAGRRAVLIQGDLRDPNEADRVVKETVDKLGSLHILINNAGVNRQALLIRQKPDLVEEILRSNLDSMIYVSRAAARIMAKNRWGRLIHMGSVTAHLGSLAQVPYAASKAGIEGMSRGIARELGGREITSNVIAPGLISTGMAESVNDNLKQEFLTLIALGRTGRADEVAAAAVYLASEEAGYVTGTVHHVNGGMFMS